MVRVTRRGWFRLSAMCFHYASGKRRRVPPGRERDGPCPLPARELWLTFESSRWAVAACSAADLDTADPQPFGERVVALHVRALEVAQQSVALPHQLHQAAAGGVVLGMGLQMLGEELDAVGEQRDLHVAGAGVLGVDPVLRDPGSPGCRRRHGDILAAGGRFREWAARISVRVLA